MASPYITSHCRQSVVSSSKSLDLIELDLGVYLGPVIFLDLIELDLGLWNRSEVCCSQQVMSPAL